MTRIFAALSLLTVGLLLANIMLGLWGGDYNGLSRQMWSYQEELIALKAATKQDPRLLEEKRTQLNELREKLTPVKRYATLHVLLGVLAALVCLLVNSICVTYFIGTGRWCKEVSDAYGFGRKYTDQSLTIKRHCFPWSILAMATTIAIVAMGAAADPGTLRRGTADWVTAHMAVAIVGTVVIAWSLRLQISKIDAHYQVIDQILEQVRRIRAERGLESEQVSK